MLAGAVERFTAMTKKLPALLALSQADQLNIIRGWEATQSIETGVYHCFVTVFQNVSIETTILQALSITVYSFCSLAGTKTKPVAHVL